MSADEQLDLFRQQQPPKCPLYGCRHGCSCSPEKRAETARRLEALSTAERTPSAPLSVAESAPDGPGDIPY